ncbi:hypothetical protein Tco_1224126 [Tanacetum coccineum]
MEVVVAATVAEAAMAVVHDGCDGGYFGEVEWRRGGGVRMMMMMAMVRWLWRRDGEVDGGVVTPIVVATAVGDDDGDVVWQWFRLWREMKWCGDGDVVDGASAIGDDLDGGRCGGGWPDVAGDSPEVGEAARKFREKCVRFMGARYHGCDILSPLREPRPEAHGEVFKDGLGLEEKCCYLFRIRSLRVETYFLNRDVALCQTSRSMILVGSLAR